jgi:hypothetical protein
MPVLTDLASAEIRSHVTKLFGTTLTRPAVLVSDGLSITYACDVNISEHDPTGRINQYFADEEEKIGEREPGSITGIPGQAPAYWQLDDSKPGHVDTTMHNVPIARNNTDLIYADVGAPVVVERSASGNWQITGFSMEMPGTYKLYPVNLELGTIGTVINLSIDTRLLTLGEMGTLAPWGQLPFGASAIFEGGVLLRIV